MMVTGHFTIPAPQGTIYAPMDIVTTLAKGLIKRGHRVTIYAPTGTKIPGIPVKTARLTPLKQTHEGREMFEALLQNPSPSDRLRERMENSWDQYLTAQMFVAAEKGEYDILYIAPTYQTMPLALSHPAIPVVYTLHDPIYPWRKAIFDLFKSSNQYLVSISDAQRKGAPKLRYAKTIYNGIDTKQFPFSEKAGDYLLWVGRINANKNTAAAIQVAKKTNKKLLIVGTHDEDEYWKKEVEPFLDENIRYEGFVERERLAEYYKGAEALLMPAIWEEPFGLVVTEAMACGTPVIAFARGSMPELIKDGVTGFLVEDIDQMAAAVQKIGTIKRKDCRAQVERRFAIETMISEYEALFQKIAKKR